MHGNHNKRHILVIMFELFCDDWLNSVQQSGRVPDGIQAVHKMFLTEAELVQAATLILSRERAAASRIHNTPSRSTANERVHCSALSLPN